MMASGTNLVMTVIGFAMSTMFIVFVCTRLICARIQLNASRRSFARANRSDLSIVLYLFVLFFRFEGTIPYFKSTFWMGKFVGFPRLLSLYIYYFPCALAFRSPSWLLHIPFDCLAKLERGLHGLEPIIFANFPMKKYSDPFFSGENNQCTVCLADYHKEDTLRILPLCGHFFHAACIDIWLHQHSTCPVCRVSLRELPEKKRFMQPLFSSAIRAQYTIQPANLNAYNLSISRRLSSTPHDSQRMQPSQDESCHSEEVGVEDRESNTILNDDCQITKKSANKEVESPSNAQNFSAP